VTKYFYDTLNRVARTELPAVNGVVGVESRIYDDTGQLQQRTDPTGAVTVYTYDKLDHLKSETAVVRATITGTFAGNAVSTYGYHPAGAMLWRQDPAGNRTNFKVNAAGRTYESVDPLTYVTAYTHDQGGRITVAKDPLGRTDEYTYDLAGRLLKQERRTAAVAPAVGTALSSTSYGYDENGNQKTVTLARTGMFSYTYDALDRLVQVDQPTEPAISTSTYGYDIAGANTRVTNGNNQSFWTTYNVWGLPEKVIEPSTTAHPAEVDRSFVTAYDAAGNAVGESQPGGVAIAKVFDPLNRVSTVTGTGSAAVAPNATKAFTYDLMGRLKQVNSASATPIVLTYDDRGLAVSATNPSGNSSYNYDINGRMTKRVDAAGTTGFEWTARSELWKASSSLDATASVFSWNADSSVSTVVRGGTTRTYGYDGIGRVTVDLLKGTAPVGDLAKQSYGYDADGNVNQQVITLGTNTGNGTHTYDYDKAGRLKSWAKSGSAVVTYTYDGAGNRKTAGASTFSYDERNRLLTGVEAGVSTSYGYTARGSLSSSVSGGWTKSFVYDSLGRNTTSNNTTSGPSLPPATRVVFTYDGLDRPVSRAYGTGAATSFTYAGLEADPSSDGSGAAGQLWARSPGGTVFASKVGTTSYSVGQNRHGDLTHLFSAAGNGSYVSSRTYDPFGGVIATAGTVVPKIGFQGDYTDPNTGDVNMGARWYRPGVANFLSRDSYAGTLNTPVSLNRYTYANSSPLNYWDPTGREGDLVDPELGAALGFTPDELNSGVDAATALAAQQKAKALVSGNSVALSPSVSWAVENDGARVSRVGLGIAHDAAILATRIFVDGECDKQHTSCLGSDPSKHWKVTFLRSVIEAVNFEVAYSAQIALYELHRIVKTKEYRAARPIGAGDGTLNEVLFGYAHKWECRAEGKRNCVDWSGPRWNLSANLFGIAIGELASKLTGFLRTRNPRVGGRSGPWVDEATEFRVGGAVGQTTEGSCVSACGEMLSEGTQLQSELLKELGDWPRAAPEALAARLGGAWRGGSLTGDMALLAANRGPMGAVLKGLGTENHMVVISPLGGGTFYVRDPWAGGSNYLVTANWIEKHVTGGVFR
jgi:RHS repeat-associated protein